MKSSCFRSSGVYLSYPPSGRRRNTYVICWYHPRALSSHTSGKSHLHEGPCRMVRKLRDIRRPLGRMVPSTCDSHKGFFLLMQSQVTLKSVDRESSTMHTLSDLRDAIPCVHTYLASPVRHAIDLFQSQTWSSLASLWSAIGVGGS